MHENWTSRIKEGLLEKQAAKTDKGRRRGGDLSSGPLVLPCASPSPSPQNLTNDRDGFDKGSDSLQRNP